MVRSLPRDESAVSGWILFVALVVAVAVVLGAYYVYFTPKAGPTPVVAQQGDSIHIDYIGTFLESDLVFDTSNASVARDNASYPKASSFSWRATWTHLTFTIGDGSVIKGFDQGVRDLTAGQATTIVVPASLGYGNADPSKIFVHKLLESVPVRVTMNETAFIAYYKTPPVTGAQATDPVYGWPVTVDVLNGIVTVTNSPVPRQTVHPYGAWTATVLGIDDTANNGTGAVWIQNRLDPGQVDLVGGTAPNGQQFYLSTVDLNAETYTLNFNRQVVGRTLEFQITVVQVNRLT
ncbi:MAG: FKBP-type peptidyl-prolyl cis-trans isomerase [Candidatus Thermoplasmatota archaeon]